MTVHAHLEPGAHLTPPAPQASEDVPPLTSAPNWTLIAPEGRGQWRGSAHTLVFLSGCSGRFRPVLAGTGAWRPLCRPGSSSAWSWKPPSPSPPYKHPSILVQDMGAQGAPRRGPGGCRQTQVLGGRLSGPGKALLSVSALTQSMLCPGGKEREKETHGVYLCHPLSRASLTLHSKAGLVPVLIPIRQMRTGPREGTPLGTSWGP